VVDFRDERAHFAELRTANGAFRVTRVAK